MWLLGDGIVIASRPWWQHQPKKQERQKLFGEQKKLFTFLRLTHSTTWTHIRPTRLTVDQLDSQFDQLDSQFDQLDSHSTNWWNFDHSPPDMLCLE